MQNLKPGIVHIGTYAPYQDGISTFTEHVLKAQKLIFNDRIDLRVAAIEIIKPDGNYPKEVDWVIHKDDKEEYIKLASDLNKKENIGVVFLQHEYGIFGGEEGEYILSFLKRIKKPVVIVLHTVLSEPGEKMIKVTKEIIDLSGNIIVLSNHSRNNLLRIYNIDEKKVRIIPHGIHPVVFQTPADAKEKLGYKDRLILGTFGFLSPSKGIEYVIEAMPDIVKRFPRAEYWLMGRTHPLVKEKYGESYRNYLKSLAENLGVLKNIKFSDKFMTIEEELEFLSLVDVYVSTSLNPDQTVSGTLSYTLGTGRCVVSTKFAQAKEIIQKDMGILVDFQKPSEYSKAIIYLLKNSRFRFKMQRTAYENTRQMLYPNIAISYLSSASGLNPLLGKEEYLLPPIEIKHLLKMTDNFGLFQFAHLHKPDPGYGYTLDDNARALIACVGLYERKRSSVLIKLMEKYLNFIKFCQREDGVFINYVGTDRLPTQQNRREDLEDSNSRALWALAQVMAGKIPLRFKILAYDIWKKAKTGKLKLYHLRSRAFFIKALYLLYGSDFYPDKKNTLLKRIKRNADYLCYVYNRHSAFKNNWAWFESKMTYSNAVIPEALLLAFELAEKENYFRIGIETLEFLTSITFNGDLCIPVGNRWRGEEKMRSYFDQQPEEVMALVLAYLKTFEITQEKRYQNFAMSSFFWFLGDNLLGIPVYDNLTSGTSDGLTKYGLNKNEGAESTVSYLISRLAISTLFDKYNRYNKLTSF